MHLWYCKVKIKRPIFWEQGMGNFRNAKFNVICCNTIATDNIHTVTCYVYPATIHVFFATYHILLVQIPTYN
jgi:hypothetical protein